MATRKGMQVNGFVIGLNLPMYIAPDGSLTKELKSARVFATEEEAQQVADRNEMRSGLEYFVDPIADGRVVPIDQRKRPFEVVPA